MENGRSVVLMLVILATVIALSVVNPPKNDKVATPSAVATETIHPGGWLPLAITGGLIFILWILFKLNNRRY